MTSRPGAAPAREPFRLRAAHTPDADDAFLYHALRTGALAEATEGLAIEHVVEEIEALNLRAAEGADPYELTALSAAAWPAARARYALARSGGSFGEGYGPIVVVRPGTTLEEARRGPVAVPGSRTTATLLLRLALPGVEARPLPFREVMPAVSEGFFPAGVVIHEGQLACAEAGLVSALDLGVWWADATGGLPCPLGLCAVRRDLPAGLPRRLEALLAAAAAWALGHRAEALAGAARYAEGLDAARTDRFVGMYVNARTVEMGEAGEAGLAELFRRAGERGLLPEGLRPEFAE